MPANPEARSICFGKLPIAGDFLRGDGAAPEFGELDDWIQHGLYESQQRIRDDFPKIYSQDLLNNLFRYPYTKIDFFERELNISRPTATKYLGILAEAGFLEKRKIGRSHFFINRALFLLLTTIQLPSA